MKVYLFACIEKNIGDDLFVKLLCERYPHVDFVITEEANYESLSKIPNLTFSSLLRKWMWASSLKPRNALKQLVAKCLQVYYTLRLPKYDMGVCIVGNAFKNMQYTGPEQSEWIRLRLKLVTDYYLISTNFGPYNDEQWKKDFDKIFSQMADVCFRDRYSYDLFKTLPQVRFAPDAVLTYGKHLCNDVRKRRVIISLIDCAFMARSEELQKAAGLYETRMVETARHFGAHGYHVTFLNSNMEQDRPACDRILSQLDMQHVDVVDYDGDLDKVDTLYKNSSCVVATRLHTIVLAWLYGLPVVPVIYDIKVANLLKACGFDAPQYDITALEHVSAEQIFQDVQQYDFVLDQRIIDAAQQQFQKIDETLCKSGRDVK